MMCTHLLFNAMHQKFLICVTFFLIVIKNHGFIFCNSLAIVIIASIKAIGVFPEKALFVITVFSHKIGDMLVNSVL